MSISTIQDDMSIEYLLDTNAFDNFVKKEVDWEKLGKTKIICTAIQREELSNIRSENSRNALLEIFSTVKPEVVQAEGGYYGIVHYGEAKYTDGDDLDRIRMKIIQADIELAMREGKKLNQKFGDLINNWSRDAIIIFTAFKRGKFCRVVSDDAALRKVCRELGINQTVRTNKFLQRFLL